MTCNWLAGFTKSLTPLNGATSVHFRAFDFMFAARIPQSRAAKGPAWKRTVVAGLSEYKYLMRECADNFVIEKLADACACLCLCLSVSEPLALYPVREKISWNNVRVWCKLEKCGAFS